MNTPADVSVCIVNWNGCQVLRDCLESLLPLHVETIVVDNASTDGSVEMMAADFPEARLIRNTANRGFAAANNQAAAVATRKYLYFLNNDTIVPPDSLGPLVDLLHTHPEIVAVGPKLIGVDGKPQRSGRNLPTLPAMLHSGVLPIRWTGIFSRQYRAYRNAFNPDVAGPVPQLAAAALLVRASQFRLVGQWDEAYEFGVEDVDLCLRLSRLGTIYYLPKVHIIHLGRVSSHLNRGSVFRSYQCGYVQFFRKHHPWRLAPLIYKIGITLDTPIRLTLLLAKAGLSRVSRRTEESARSRQRAAAVWFFVTRGMARFWKS